MNYLFMALEDHFDKGFGATAESFKEAADSLHRRRRGRAGFHPHLPISFLYRHAIELFLKSMIIVLHRRLAVPYGEVPPSGEPMVRTKNGWKRMYQEHSVLTLFDHWTRLLNEHRLSLNEICRTDWLRYPRTLPKWIQCIEENDSSSTFFRYPVTRDRERDASKSSFKQVATRQLLAEAKGGDRTMKVMILCDEDGNVSRTFRFDADPVANVMTALRRCADLLSAAHVGFRMELADGY